MKEPVYIPAVQPDRLCFRDEEIADGYAEMLRAPEGRIKHPWVSLRNLYLVKDSLKEESWTPDWLLALISEYEWGNAKRFDNDRRAWILTPKLGVIEAPYTLTMVNQIAELDSPYYYSSLIDGWIFDIQTHDLEFLKELFDSYKIITSPGMNDVLSGREDWASRLVEAVESQRERGVVPLSDFESGRKYKPWQEQAVSALHELPLLADQVGLGKGGSFIGAALALENYFVNEELDDTIYPVLVLTTKSLKYEIVEEILNWKHDASIQILEGQKSAPLEEGAHFYVLNHDILFHRLEDILELEPRAILVDEAHAYKNKGAKRTQAMQTLAENVRSRVDDPCIILASGTPFDNAPAELWSLLEILGKEDIFGDWAMSRLGKSETVDVYWNRNKKKYMKKSVRMTPQRAFEEYFCGAEYRGNIYMYSGPKHVAELNRLLVDNVMVRRRKSDVMNPMPEIKENVVTVEMDPEWEPVYIEQEEEFERWMRDQVEDTMMELGITKRKALQIIARKLASAGKVMKMGKLRQTLAYAKVEPMVQWIHKFMAGDPDIVKTNADKRKKLIVFASHVEPRSMLVNHPELQQYGLVTILSGSEQDGPSIQEHKKMFQEDPDVRLMICSEAAREGHTLTAAWDVALLEVPYTASRVVQMAGRCWARLPDIHDAFLHYFVVQGTEDGRSLQRIRLKAISFNAIIDGEGQDEDLEKAQEEDIEQLVELAVAKSQGLGIVGSSKETGNG